MTYLIIQMLMCLIIAFILGFLVGYLFYAIFCKGKKDAKDTKDNHIIPAFIDPDDVDEDDIDLDDMTFIDSDNDLDHVDFGIERLEGVGPRTADLFAKVNVRTIGDYLRKLYTPDARQNLAAELEIKVQPIHDWASMADLMRIDGVDHQYAELLYVAGVQTVGDLAKESPSDLVNKLADANTAGKQRISPEDPTLDMVEHWVTRATGKKAVVQV